MSDKQNPDDPRFDWLYGGKESQDQPADTDSTQVLPTGGGAADPTAPQRSPGRGGDDGSESTQILDATGGQPGPAPHRSEATNQPSQGAGAAEQAPQSFGGTYEAPPRQDQQRLSQQRQDQQRLSQPPFVPPARPDSRGSGGQPPAGVPQSSRPPRGPRNRRKWVLRGVLILVLAWIAFLILVPVWAYSKITKVDAEPSGERPADSAGTTYLLVGSDSREDLSEEERRRLGTGAAEGQRTDTIMLLHVTSGDGPNVLLSIPRDSFVPIPGQNENKINAAYAFGGPQLLVQTVEEATGLHVDNYIEVGFSGFVDLVDAVGGIEICPKQAVNDPKAGGLELEKGCQEVDGVTALGYSRSRAFPKGDITRAEHQREVIAAVGSEAVSWQSIVLPWRYWSLNMAAAETLRVGENVGPIDLARFAWAMSHTSGEDTKRCVVPYTDLGASTSAGSAVLWDEQKADALFDAIREDDTSSIQCSPR